MVDVTQLSLGRVEKLLVKGIKQAIAQNNISSTRSGNKELDFLAKEVASAPFDSEAAVQKVATALGQKISELSQKSDQKNLDAGVIRQLRFKQNWAAAFDIPEALPVEKISKKTSKSVQTLITMPAKVDKSQETQPEPAAVEPDSAEEAEPESAMEEPELENVAVGEPELAIEEETETESALEASESGSVAVDEAESEEVEPEEVVAEVAGDLTTEEEFAVAEDMSEGDVVSEFANDGVVGTTEDDDEPKDD